MKNYVGSTCHEIGYSFDINMPDLFTKERVEELLQEFIDYTDDLYDISFSEFLNTKCETLTDKERSILETHDVKHTDEYFRIVHREVYVNEIEDTEQELIKG